MAAPHFSTEPESDRAPHRGRRPAFSIAALGLLLLALLAWAGPARPESLRASEPVDTSSPSATYQSFLKTVRTIEARYADYAADKTPANATALRQSVRRSHRLLDLSDQPPAVRGKVAAMAIGYLHDLLAQAPPIDPATIPGAVPTDPDKLPPRWIIPGTDIEIARVAAGETAGEYLFSARTIDDLSAAYEEIAGTEPLASPGYPSLHRLQIAVTGPFIPDALIARVPPALNEIVLDTPLWKILATLVIVLAVLIAAALWARLAWLMARRAQPTVRYAWRISMPLVFLALFSASEWAVLDELNLTGTFAVGEHVFSSVAHYLAAAWIAWTACFLVLEAIIAWPKIPRDVYDAHLLRLTARVTALLTTGAILAYGANEIGIPALGLVAGFGVGGIAVALAAQSTIENLFGGLSIFADRPFRIGDEIEYATDLEHIGGVVEAIGLRSSRIRATDGTLISVPNGDLAKVPITNRTRRDKHLFRRSFAVRADASAAQLRTLLARLRSLVAALPEVDERTRGDLEITITDLDIDAITIEVRAYVLAPDARSFHAIQERLIFGILDEIETLGAAIAGPGAPAEA
ncbi:mechanosensitive ion channel family protein [Segnochrobactrum spirostomi]|uniref:Mechanosensitive ion channel n=1 Tax=Segnochrobactrum spirostomi TaxID=2608987 RepID=A0A6A7Y767_9HYPH|nr:mechanosensitive ion channel domain-containing protein [Segnochrobactrum spirostomi]MQT14666.1 mechanosensitive ion channel [Segnochrobactrum spirostomi]